ncbi:hypothetical protein CMO92_00425 [Candidatus Woesearchaeota archaeon]|nr:hypothetical protein [Candidatus Woesearchaeota archaeon]
MLKYFSSFSLVISCFMRLWVKSFLNAFCIAMMMRWKVLLPMILANSPRVMMGGQAVIEGVMMKSEDSIATAVRKQDGSVSLKKEAHVSLIKRKRWLNIPFLRGIIMMGEMLHLGIKTMQYSANESIDKEEEKLSGKEFALTILLSIGLVLVLFKLLPLFLASKVQPLVSDSNALFNFFDGFFKVGLFVLYLWLIGRMSDVKRLFGYHGAEHKAVHNFESDKPLSVENSQSFTTLHPRCGTTFLLFVLVLSAVVYMVIPLNVGFWAKYGLRILFLPFIAGISYELIRLGGRFYHKRSVRTLMAPGLALQRLTTREPLDEQVEVALAALNAVVTPEKKAVVD